MLNIQFLGCQPLLIAVLTDGIGIDHLHLKAKDQEFVDMHLPWLFSDNDSSPAAKQVNAFFKDIAKSCVPSTTTATSTNGWSLVITSATSKSVKDHTAKGTFHFIWMLLLNTTGQPGMTEHVLRAWWLWELEPSTTLCMAYCQLLQSVAMGEFPDNWQWKITVYELALATCSCIPATQWE
ncbi:hypothetical protein CROQUDRAFT_134816 [Cronartium quercuum f. sp. fusiforme G11]|uniref:Uncharacterized protein n=1 Tax=Cronartium quercuum f. sp. fusiforme G11 TaxID=708437 RepID=A0A9P6T914_9BASI|nr:hypothetical protein CROQUDRAFT_134816 [Cronartium quercuum f. sp. fusiforme G11]